MFVAEIADFKIVSNVLKSVIFKEFAIIRPLKEGLKITVEEMRCIETSVYVPSSMFTSYAVNSADNEEEIQFKISLKIFAECLQICGDESNPILKMSYNGPGESFNLLIVNVEDNITVDCQIKTLTVSDFSEICLAQGCNLNKIVVNAAEFVELLSDLDNDVDEMELIISPDYPNLKITGSGVMGESVVEISKNSEIVVLFQCQSEIKSCYAFNNIRQILKAMALASKVHISTGDSGLLGLQLLINSGDRQMFVEYYVTSLFGEN